MPRGASSPTVRRSRKAKAQPEATEDVTTSTDQPNPTDTNDKETNMTTTEEKPAAPAFDFVIEAAPDDYEPERKNPGRTRTPSPFDDALVECKGKGWMKVPYRGEEMKAAIQRELNKAKQFRGLGLDLNVTDTHVEWKSRDLQKRAPRKPKADAGAEVLAEGQETLDADGDNDH